LHIDPFYTHSHTKGRMMRKTRGGLAVVAAAVVAADVCRLSYACVHVAFI